MTGAAIAGAAMTSFGEHDDGVRQLLRSAGERCLANSPLSPAAVDHVYVATSGGQYQHESGLANGVVQDLGLVPSFTQSVDQTSAAGGGAIYSAVQSVASGASEATLVVGAEKLTHLRTEEATDIISGITHPAEYRHGVTMPTFAGLTARSYLEQYEVPREALADVAVKNHAHGVRNPKAQFQRAITRETVLESPVVADPLRLYDFCPISDGAAAVLVTSEDTAEALTDRYAAVSGVAGATDTHVVHERSDPTVLDAVVESGEAAFEMAGINRADIDVAELHDMFTILEPLQLEGLGFADPGEAWRFARTGKTHRDGDLPVNTSGGLKSKGHPIAASGIAQAVELYEQLLGEAGDRQVEAGTGLACNVGGFGNCVVTTILERGDPESGR